MDVFAFRDQLISDYSTYIRSFINISDKRIHDKVEQEMADGLLWPDPLLQLNPAFEPGETIDILVDKGVLHPECSRVFRLNKDKPEKERELRLHRHQADAIRSARSGKNYVLTTGTGSGKSLSYIVPIVDHVLRRGSGRGIQAIVVYPMNALANSQYGELEKFLRFGYPDGKGPVTFEKYTGQEDDQARQAIIASPPDILLTNYVMLELILTRPAEADLIGAARGLQFLVLDELHTYRGRQGADVALLVRRVRDRLNASGLQCVGTSATMASDGSYADRQAAVAEVATKLFGSQVEVEHVIGETLRRTTPERDLGDMVFREELTARVVDPKRKPPQTFDSFRQDPLSIWIESTFGVRRDPVSGRLERAVPQSITGEAGAARALSNVTGAPVERCVSAIEEALLAGYTCEPNPETGFPPFAFRLHQFISRGDTVYASLEAEKDRYITVRGQQYMPGDRSRILLPMAFCRECGQEYYTVRRMGNGDGTVVYSARDLMDQYNDQSEGEAGFLYVDTEDPWPDDMAGILQRIPDDWTEPHKGGIRVRPDRTKDLPQRIHVATDGSEKQGSLRAHFLHAPFRFCPNCGVTYGSRQRSDFAKLATLGSEGRSTATTVLSLSAIRHLRGERTLDHKARKLLSFTDNRQDASLQAGHFNDFIEIGMLRGAIFRAVDAAGSNGLRYDQLTQCVAEALNLPIEAYASDPEVLFLARQETDEALRNVLGYRLYRDLKRGWRVTAPNLEQCGLLIIQYASLDQLCAAEQVWQGLHPALVSASPATRKNVAKTLLDYMRRELAINVSFLDANEQERIKQQSQQRLIAPWALDEHETLEKAAILLPRARQPRDFGGHLFLSSRGGFGLYLGRPSTFAEYDERIKLEDREQIIRELLETLRKAGLVKRVLEPGDADDVPGYQIPASAIIWTAGDGTQAFRDPIRTVAASSEGASTNAFFVDFYREVARQLHGLEAREHTAQVPYDDRVDRENRFREGQLPILYCSPTMELGVDIAQLNVVNMRNAPPTPANYAQRSGRAGRSGQPALVFTYCSTGSSHDQYFFKRPERMVAGVVTPPRLDLANEDLVRAHVQAIWLAETGQSLHKSLRELLDVNGDEPTLALLQSVVDCIESDGARARAKKRAENVLGSLQDELDAADWYGPEWLEDVLRHVVRAFDAACDRWRSLYRSALTQVKAQNKIIQDATRSLADKTQAKRLRREAEQQLDLLTEVANVVQSDFYSYRYFASEGFLPGYNFPRLPLSAYIPGRTIRQKDEFLSRPRFLAISEFGPRAIVYHEGSRYVINKVILPVSEDDVLTRRAKRCETCGYLHPITDGSDGVDLCERCGNRLSLPLTSLFRLENVSTRRRDRINSDEEERMRMGYEIITGVRFAEHKGRPSHRSALIRQGEDTLAEMVYGHASTLWRINLGWARRSDQEQYGFLLDTERGYWASNKQAAEDDDDPMSNRVQRVIPYVEDRRNCMVLEPKKTLSAEQLISLQSALKNAIQIRYQLEDDELAVEPLPNRDDPKQLLFFEAAEGGAGVLRRLLDDAGALAEVAREALHLCHFDPDTGEDLNRAPGSSEDCEAACYDCLMSYRNQRDHQMLDRKAVRDVLMSYAQAHVSASSTAASRSSLLEQLLRLSGSTLERKWLRTIDEQGLRLPSKAQVLIKQCGTRPDFFYEEAMAAIYVDGPVHDYPERQARDETLQSHMEDLGYTVLRFHHEDDWSVLFKKYPHIFGSNNT